MKKWGRMLTGFMSLCLALYAAGADCRAAQNVPVTPTPYTYTVTIHLGNPDNGGSFTKAPDIYKNGAASAAVTGDTVVIRGLNAGDQVNLEAQDFVTVAESGKYYAKAVRQSGRDEALAVYEVKGDMDFVVAYGIRGEMVAYTVNYQDSAGNSLAQSRTYYGNVGDKPVVAFRYIEGYEPQAYNLTGTLKANAAENVFTFVYTPVEEGAGGEGAQTPAAPGQEGGAGGAPAVPAPDAAEPAAPGTPAGTPATPAPGTPAGAPVTPAPAGPGAPAAPDDGPDVPDEGPDAPVNVPDEEVPLNDGPEELVDLDDENVPLADIIPDEEVPLDAARGKRMGAVAIAAGVAGAAALAGVLIWLWMQKRKKEEEA